ncbi:MAG TPA: HAD family hydrolase [Nitrolancea sp.]|jgi:D-glycero-D-manno-heptose 1,7-bisphosphate phosphatase|nr:HAD family hydrolase [Nitrolancea sp.]
MSANPAVFLDRDGTLVEPRHYPSRPEDLILFPEIAPQLRHLRRAGFRLAVITNQSGIARGYFTEDDLTRMHVYLRANLHRLGVELDGFFHCPHHPEGTVPEFAIECDCRKPEPGLLLTAAAQLNIDLASSWFIGDILNDVEAGNRAGCRTILVDLGTEAAPTSPIRTPHYVARSTEHALRIVRSVERCGPGVETSYTPAAWAHTHGERTDLPPTEVSPARRPA